MMIGIVIIIFVLGYMAIAFEHKIKIDKAASALVTGVLCWLFYFFYEPSTTTSESELIHQLGEIAAILFFLMGAMTIVEVVDSHHGFNLITDVIRTKSKPILLVWVSILTFFLSAVLDNLTTAIVMTSLCGKLLNDKKDRLWFVSMVIIVANAGGAWSPLGDVTTTMLWIGGQITAYNIIAKTILPSIVVALVPLLILVFKFRNQKIVSRDDNKSTHRPESKIMLFTGIGLLIFVPVFKTITHMPPFMGMLFALGIIWIISSIIHLSKHADERYKYSVTQALRKIDTSSILFFLGILLAVSALQSFGILGQLAEYTVKHIDNYYVTGTILGLFSAIIDNVPLVAAAQGMFSMEMYPTDHVFWEFLALSAGTGGSAIIIGSAAGVAVMGIEKINFFWYLKNISWLALAGFFAGLITYILQQSILG
ncbi:MAG TPA: sodium:proton antiporter NhaD [Bacteroidales bacterium]|nr:sodium:proton antiporter NhaD [Bacteroidales bacterium]